MTDTELPPIGVLSLGTYLPAPRMTSDELARATGISRTVIEEKFGVRAKPMPGPDDHPCQMGARAAQRALDRAGVDPLEVDVVISISEEYKERPLMVSGRIYNLGEDGTFGQYLEGYPEGGGLPVGVVGTLLQLRQLEGEFRANIGFTNPSSTDGAVQVTLFDAGGTELIRYRVDLDPRALVQDLEPYSRRASRPDLGWGFAEVEVLEGGPVLISASVVDSRTNDATTVPVKVGTEVRD